MAHFAQLDSNNVVTQVIVVSNDDISDSNGTESENIGVAFCQKLIGAETNWKQTSYNANMRGNYAGIGMTYMSNVATLGVGSTDIFISQQPHASWTVGINTAHEYVILCSLTKILLISGIHTPHTTVCFSLNWCLVQRVLGLARLANQWKQKWIDSSNGTWLSEYFTS